jgi:uncharacterized membrane protein YccF (DUF307 family)
LALGFALVLDDDDFLAGGFLAAGFVLAGLVVFFFMGVLPYTVTVCAFGLSLLFNSELATVEFAVDARSLSAVYSMF